MTETLQFWMGRGVDGFRVDVIHGLGKPAGLPDLPPELASIPVASSNDDPSTHPIISELRTELDGWSDPPPRLMVGEVFLPEPAQVLTYYGTAAAPELHLAFNFKPMSSPWQAEDWRQRIDEVETLFGPARAWPTWALSNHDRPRHRTRYGSEARARAAAVLLSTLRGTPFLYAGEELGLEDAVVPPDRRVDPGGRDGCRAPIPWDDTPSHGWAGGPDAWLPWPPGADAGRTVAGQLRDPASTLHLYRRLLAARRGSRALQAGTFEWLEAPAGVLAYRRTAPREETGGGGGGRGGGRGGGADPDADERVIAVNFVGTATAVCLPPGDWSVEVTTAAGGETAPGVRRAGRRRFEDGIDLGADEAVILRRD